MEHAGGAGLTEVRIARLSEQPDVNFGPQSVYRRLVGGDGVPVFTGVQTCAPGYATKPHWHPYVELLFVVEGEAFAYLVGRESERHQLRAGDMIALPPLKPHVFGNAGTAPLRMLGIHTSPERIVNFVDGTQTSAHGFVAYDSAPPAGLSGAPAGPALWRGMDAAQMHAEFNTRAMVPDADRHIAERAARSVPVRASLPGERDVRYGKGPRQVLDVYPGRDDGPIVVFFHGGAWRAGSKEGAAYLAEPLHAAGITTVIPSYDLIPAVGLREMMAEAVEAVAWVGRHLQRGRRRLVLAGHSAGAQLAGMALAHDFRAEGLARSPASAAMLISGSFDMEPHRHHGRYTDMKLDERLVQQVSPIRNPPLEGDVEFVVAVGGAESRSYVRQSEEYRDMLVARGHRAGLMVVPGDHHFSVVARLGEPAHPLARALQALALGEALEVQGDPR